MLYFVSTRLTTRSTITRQVSSARQPSAPHGGLTQAACEKPVVIPQPPQTRASYQLLATSCFDLLVDATFAITTTSSLPSDLGAHIGQLRAELVHLLQRHKLALESVERLLQPIELLELPRDYLACEQSLRVLLKLVLNQPALEELGASLEGFDPLLHGCERPQDAIVVRPAPLRLRCDDPEHVVRLPGHREHPRPDTGRPLELLRGFGCSCLSRFLLRVLASAVRLGFRALAGNQRLGVGLGRRLGFGRRRGRRGLGRLGPRCFARPLLARCRLSRARPDSSRGRRRR